MEKNILKGLIIEFIVIFDWIEEIKRNFVLIIVKENFVCLINV